MKIYRIAVFTLVALLGAISATAQSNPVPNPSFESWGLLPALPTGWMNFNDLTGLSGAITKSSSAHSGKYAAAGKVVASGDSTLAPALATVTINLLTQQTSIGFPISFTPTALEGYCKFTGVGGDYLQVYALLMKSGTPTAIATVNVSENQSSFTHFIGAVAATGTGTADSAIIFITIANNGGNPHVGSSFVVDDIALTTATAPAQLVFVGVQGNPNLAPGSTATISWLASGQLTTPIDLDVSYDSSVSWTPIQHGLSATATSYDWALPNKPALGVVVRATSGDSHVFSFPFDIAVAGVEANSAPTSMNVLAVPNPFTNSTSIQYDLAESAPVALSVTDLLGHEVYRVPVSIQTPGHHAAEINGSALAAGVYQFELRIGNAVKHGRLSLVR